MFKKFVIFLTLFLFSFSNNIKSKERSIMIMKLKYGEVKIELFDEIAPNHVKRIKTLANSEKYDGVAFHRVIDGFMAQTGDVKFGNTKLDFNAQMVGTGGSDLPDLKAEFNNIPHQRGVLSMARSQSPDSANSQFFICFDSHPHLDRNYTAFGRVISGMEFIDKIKKGAPGSGVVDNPDIIVSLRSAK
ncbi:MAG: peptidylprolyl isomerase [Proteobacteria bacterium]|jgi:cyclophilin family peptidyl-prolyl cis-trans isomerase|nr:peptidylprolyl isomerase [Candidatus Fonsibacter sp. PEL5]NKA16360.1 peptidylprolyl isomerase [Candidatus Fonsibacter sp. PEL55]